MSDKAIITIKSTTVVTFDPGDVPPGLIMAGLKKQNDGTGIFPDSDFFIYDLGGTQETVIDEVTLV